MPRSTFEAVVAKCRLTATTYTPRTWMGMREPLIDFSRESDPKGAQRCFNSALQQVNSEAMVRTHAEHSGYIWATQE